MLAEIKRYYKSNGILSTHFDCPHKKVCKSKSENFYGPKSAFISSGYEKGELPRLLFLSLDPGNSDKKPDDRLPKGVRSIEEKRDIGSLNKGRHWYRTHELAFAILKRFKNDLKLEDAKHYFAHANSVKCSMNNPGHKQAHQKVFENCRSYIWGESLILNPDILVTQGSLAKIAVEELVLNDVKLKRRYKVIELNGKQVFWLHTDHPRNFGAFGKQYQQGKGWTRYSRIIFNWYSSNNK